MNRSRPLLVIALLAITLQAQAVEALYPDGGKPLTVEEIARLPDRGGRIRARIEAVPYRVGGVDLVSLRVLDLEADSPLRSVGVLTGDRLVSIDERLFRSLDDAIRHIRSFAPGAEFKVDFVRPGDPRDFQGIVTMPDIAQRAADPDASLIASQQRKQVENDRAIEKFNALDEKCTGIYTRREILRLYKLIPRDRQGPWTDVDRANQQKFEQALADVYQDLYDAGPYACR